MPCVVDTTYEDNQRAAEMKAEFNLVTRLLCEICQTVGGLPPEALRWYAKHREVDERREKAEREREDERLKDVHAAATRRVNQARDELACAEADLARKRR
jgi:hypothetical protein